MNREIPRTVSNFGKPDIRSLHSSQRNHVLLQIPSLGNGGHMLGKAFMSIWLVYDVLTAPSSPLLPDPETNLELATITTSEISSVTRTSVYIHDEKNENMGNKIATPLSSELDA